MTRAFSQTTYYVSPTGSDSNSGTSPSSPWQTLTKVSDTQFAPGSQILFQDGANWYGQQLSVSSSGTSAEPITYGTYGSGANPTFWGSVIVPSTSFEPVSGEPDTYFYPTSTPVNSFLVNHQFTHNADLLSGQTTDTGNIAYVESNPDTSYYDASASTPGLYVNLGSPINSGNVYTASVQDDVIYAYQVNNIVIKNLNVSETGKENAGYGVRVQASSNVQLLNSTVTGAGKHAVGVIDSTNFVGENLSASNLLPDQGYGGATAYVAYADSTVSNTTSSWINDSFTNANGPYQAFLTHNDPSSTNSTPIASVVVQNMTTNSDPGISIYSTGNEQVNIQGGSVANGTVDINGGNTTVNGLLITGSAGAISFEGGTGNILENSIIAGSVPNWEAGHDGAIIDSGTGTTIRYNTVVMGAGAGGTSAAIALENNSTGSQIYGNIIDTPNAAIFQRSTGTPSINMSNNLFGGTATPMVIFFNFASPASPVANLPSSISSSELFGNPNFVDAADGNYALEPNSIAAYAFDPGTGQYVLDDYYNNVRPSELASLGAIEETAVSLTWDNASGNGVWDRGSSANWNDGAGSAVYADQNTVLFDDLNNGSYSVTLNTTVKPGLVYVGNNSGNYVIQGSGSIAGSASLSKIGTGTLTLATANSYSGGTTVSAGTVVAAVKGALPNAPLSINGGLVRLAAGTGVMQTPSLTITGNGALDITNDGVLIHYGSGADPIASIAALVASGYAGGSWSGAGIVSSTAAAAPGTYGIGYADSADPGNPAGLATGTIEILYTLLGDANLDGKVNGTDFAILATHFNQGVTGWDEGDFNYDGKVNGTDFALFASNFNQGVQTAADVAAMDAFAEEHGLPLNIPEPGSAGLVAAGGLVIGQRRRRARRK